MKAPWSALAAGLFLAPALVAPEVVNPLQPLQAAPLPAATISAGRPELPGSLQGRMIRINDLEQRASWLLEGDPQGSDSRLWLPLEVLQQQLGVSSSTRADGTLELEWFGHTLQVPTPQQRSLEDEVAVEVGALLKTNGVLVSFSADTLALRLPSPRLLQVRTSRQTSPRRIVLDLEGPALVRREAGEVQLSLHSSPEQRTLLQDLGLPGRQQAGRLWLSLGGSDGLARVFTLGQPARVVIDLPAAEAGSGPPPVAVAPSLDPRLQTLLGRSLLWDRRELSLAGRRFRLNAISLDPRSAPLELRPLRRDDGMEGLSLLPNLARRWDALVAINGGYFNRVRRLPLGALREEGRWLSGPILNRGAIGWEPGQLPRFGRLQLQEWLTDSRGDRWPLTVVNSGYVQRGLSRYTADWGPTYRALSGNESGLRLRDGVVVDMLNSDQLAAGIPIGAADTLVISRGGSLPPWRPGDALQLESLPSDPLGHARHVIGGGPLLLQDGRVVLQGAAEGFSAAFLSQGAPRTVIAGDGQRLQLITLEGLDQPGPTLAETATLLQRLGMRDALNLDGGSSTGLVLGGTHAVKGRGVAAAIHHGLGLVLRPPSGRPQTGRPDGPPLPIPSDPAGGAGS